MKLIATLMAILGTVLVIFGATKNTGLWEFSHSDNISANIESQSYEYRNQ